MVKKTIFILLCIFAVNRSVFCLQECYIDVGFGYKNINVFEGSTEPLGNEKGMLGLSANVYNFQDNKNIGVFFTVMPILIPVYISTGNDGPGTATGLFQDLTIGASFRLPIITRFMMLFGLGLNIFTERFDCFIRHYQKYHNFYTVNLGLNGEAAIKFDITPKWYLFFSLNMSYSFLNYTYIYETYKNVDSGWQSQSVLGTSFFLGTGWNVTYDDWFPKKNK